MTTTKHRRLDKLLEANPIAKEAETVVREALDELEMLRRSGFGGNGFTLVSPFGEKGRFRAGAIKRVSGVKSTYGA